MRNRRLAPQFVVAAVAPWCVLAAGYAHADAATQLTTAVQSLRSNCPPLQFDPLVQRASELMMRQTDDYIAHREPYVPLSDPLPALRTIGYTGQRAQLLSGYGTTESDAIHGLLLQAPGVVDDCVFSRVGVATMRDDEGGFVLTSVVIAT